VCLGALQLERGLGPLRGSTEVEQDNGGGTVETASGSKGRRTARPGGERDTSNLP
jgi:hypothetical protein